MKVVKIGGGCLKDVQHLKNLVTLINREYIGESIVLVISAFSGVTDSLIIGMEQSLHSETIITTNLAKIKEIHYKFAYAAINSPSLQLKTIQCIDEKIAKLERLYYGISFTGEILSSIKAQILGYGERLAVIIVANVLNSYGINSIPLEADTIGLITDSSFENATADLLAIKNTLKCNLLPIIEKKCIPVITGFFGCNSEGKVTNFGRNGSDYSAATIAYALETEYLEIWKDVDGFMTADPKLVPSAQRIEHLSYYEAAELSYFGAKILHPRTVEPLIQGDINLHLRNIYNPKSLTLVEHNVHQDSTIIKSITYNKEVAVIHITGSGVGYKPGIIGDIGNRLNSIGVNIYTIITAQTCINILIDSKDIDKSYKALSCLQGGIIEKIVIQNNIALIAAVGEGLLKNPNLVAKIISSVADKGINIEMISSGASKVTCYFIIQQSDLQNAIQAVHSKFFDSIQMPHIKANAVNLLSTSMK